MDWLINIAVAVGKRIEINQNSSNEVHWVLWPIIRLKETETLAIIPIEKLINELRVIVVWNWFSSTIRENNNNN